MNISLERAFKSMTLWGLDMGSIATQIPILISLTALFFAVRSYRRKSGILIRGSYAIGSSRACDDWYLSSITLENVKDRATTIFAIYLRLGYNNYIEIENFEKSPLILRAFETYKKDYGPIEFYSFNLFRIDIGKLLLDQKVKKQLFLSTSEGKYKVPLITPKWSPLSDYFSNHMTITAKTVRSIYKEKAIGSNIKYVVQVTTNNGEEEIIPIHFADYKLQVFNNFSLSKHDLESKANLELLLKTQIANGNLICKSFEVYNVQAWREKAHRYYLNHTVPVVTYGAIRYYVFGKIMSLILNWRNKRIMLKNRKQGSVRAS